VAALASIICSYKNHSHICITGGEPLLQKEALLLLLKELANVDTICSVVIQTNGSLDVSRFLLPKVTIAMDYKTKSSGFADKMLNDNLISLRCQDELKFVIANDKDFENSIVLQQRHEIQAKIVYSPAYPLMQYDKLARMILDSNIHCKLSLQLHRIIWPNIERGV
jgi:7-carboxy-7-deazaguanine synthase